jgi:CMP-N-acetylneuraminic acid synthetase
MKILIPARKGSKGLPGKNRILFEKTASIIPEDLRTRTFVSTDDDLIKDLASKFNFNIHHRDESIARDETSIKDVAVDFIKTQNEFDTTIMLYLTYPERQWSDVVRAIKFIEENSGRSLLCKKNVKTHPYLTFLSRGDVHGDLLVNHELYRRQEYPECFEVSHFISIFQDKELKFLNSQLYNKDTIFMQIDDKIDVDTLGDLKNYEYKNNC